MNGPIVIIGDCLLDVDVEGVTERLCPDAPAPVVDVLARRRRPGGAGLAALLATGDGAGIVLVTAIGTDVAGRHLEELLAEHMEVVRLPLLGTTVRKTRIRARGRTLVRIDTGDGRACEVLEDHRRAGTAGGRAPSPREAGPGEPRHAPGGPLRERLAAVLREARAVLVSDYGRGVAEVCHPLLRDLGVPVVWDPHPRGATPVPGCALVTPSEAEARQLAAEPYATPERAAGKLVGALGVEAVAVTLGERGGVLAHRDGRCARISPPEVAMGRDSCGAGDRFAATAALALADGAPVEDAVRAAIGEATGFVERGGAAAVRPLPRRGRSPALRTGVPAPRGAGNGAGTANGARAGTAPEAPPPDTAALVRASGGRLVATGGCFDLLHAGHVSLLRRARALGDALVVCLNSDVSVRRLKGPARPMVGERDRIEVLRALECVDDVVLFEEDTPAALIERLRPHVWVKGGDYAETDLPEAEAVRRAGGEVVILPTVPGRSTTGLIAAARAAR